MQSNQSIIFCRNMKALRRGHGYSKKKMAEVCGVSVATITKVEAEILPPRLRVTIVFRVSDHFALQPRQLLLPMLGKKCVE